MGKAIKMIRGTSNSFEIALRDENGSFYSLKEGEVLRFGVKDRKELDTIKLVKEMTANNVNSTGDAYVLTIDPQDTEGLDPRCNYIYDVGLQSGTDYYNVIPCSEFTLGINVTSKEE